MAHPTHHGEIEKLVPFFGKAIYGDFGAGDTNGGLTDSGVLAQAVIPGASAGYVVAANGASLKTISGLASVNTTFPAGAYANGPQGTQNASPCSPCVILGLTPALVAQFQPQNTLKWTATDAPFYNSGLPSSARYGVQLNYSVSGSGPQSGLNTPTQFDSGTSQYELGFQNVGGHDSASQITLNSSAPGAQAPTSQAVPDSPYQVQRDTGALWNNASPANIIGLPFYLQNSVLYDITGQAIAYSSNFVTDANIATTPSSPLVIDSNSVPLGLAGAITGSGGVTIANGDSATLTGATTYTGLTSVAGGYLALAGPGAIATPIGVDVTQGGVFDISGSGETLPAGPKSATRSDLTARAQPLTPSPYVALQAQTVQNPSYAESDLTFSGFGLSYASSHQGYARGEIGVRFDAPVPLPGATVLDLSARAAYGYGWLGSPTMSVAFETLPGADFTVSGATLPRNAAFLTAQAELTVGPNLSAVLKLDGAAAPGANASGTLRYAF